MFEVEKFIADCEAAVAADPSHKGVREVVAEAVSDPAAVLRGLGAVSYTHLTLPTT